MTSARLSTDAEVQNRWFPKTRSWLALGAPLELLSPLSVARILLLLALLGWLGMLPDSPRAGVIAVIVAELVTLTALGLSLRIRDLSAGGCHAVILATLAAAGTMVSIVGTVGAILVGGMLLLGVAVFSGLFLAPLAILRYQVLAAVLTGLTIGRTQGVAAGIIGVPTSLVTGLMTALTIALVTGAARRRTGIDPDTGLPNGYGLALHLDGLRQEGPFVITSVVLRGLSDAREALGHRAGAELVRRAVEDLGQVMPTWAWIARVDFDELVVVAPVRATDGEAIDDSDAEARGAEQALALAQQLGRGIGAGRYVVGSIGVVLRAHFGFVVAPFDGDDVTELSRQASVTARSAMTAGVVLARWAGADGSLTPEDLSLLADLRTAADRGELSIAYQPQIEPDSGRTVAAEALLRWTSPEHGVVSPGVFIPLAERVGLIDQLTDWVLDEVLDAQLRWDARGIGLRVSINVSPLSLSDPELPARVLEALRIRGLPPERLGIEITETAAVNVVQAVDRLRTPHEAGVRVAIDDFGTGTTSLAILANLPVDELKVDQQFVLGTATSEVDVAIVETVKDLAHRLSLDAVAEGVEDEAISERMQAMGFDLLQGYHFARPLSEDDLLARVASATASTGPHPTGARVR